MAYVIDKSFHPMPAETDNKPDPRSIDGLIAWLETKDPAETYTYSNNCGCAFAQYGEHLGLGTGFSAYVAFLSSFSGQFTAVEPFRAPIPHHPLGRDASIACIGDHTFGALLDRARAHKASHP